MTALAQNPSTVTINTVYNNVDFLPFLESVKKIPLKNILYLISGIDDTYILPAIYEGTSQGYLLDSGSSAFIRSMLIEYVSTSYELR